MIESMRVAATRPTLRTGPGQRTTTPPHTEVVQRQLGKGDKNKIRGIYNRAAYWKERVRLLQHWADRIDSLRTGAPAISRRRSAA